MQGRINIALFLLIICSIYVIAAASSRVCIFENVFLVCDIKEAPGFEDFV